MKLIALLFMLVAGGSSALLAPSATAGCTTPGNLPAIQMTKRNPKQPLTTVSQVDLARYMGTWRVLARIPHYADRGCVDAAETYERRADGKIASTFTCRKKGFDEAPRQFSSIAWVRNETTNAEWRVRLFGPFTAKVFISDLDAEYQWAAMTHLSRKYGWILARDRTLPDSTYNAIMRRLEKNGYDPADFQKVPQLHSQMPA